MHHRFIVPCAIYAVCCKAKDLFESGVNILLPWLAMIEAKAPGSPVLIVGTFCDQLPSKTLKQCDKLRKCIIAQFSTPSAPALVEINDVVFVECSTKRHSCIIQLRKKLYELAFTVTIPPTDPHQKHNPEKLLQQLVPVSYMEFQQRIFAKAARIRRHSNKQEPVALWDELQQMASGTVSDEKELHCAVDHMKRVGTLLHFDAEGLERVYFIDPQWLIDILSLVVSTSNISILSDFTGQQNPEIVTTQNLMKCLSKNDCTPAFQNVLCKLLFHFELAIPIDESRLFFPSLLLTHSQLDNKLYYSFPINFYLDVSMSRLTIRDTYSGDHSSVKQSLSAPRSVTLQPTGLCYRRMFVSTVVPVSLWPRLISRCITGYTFLEIVKKNCLATLQFESLHDRKTRVGNSILEWIYWKNRIELKLSGMTLLQISSVDLTSLNKEAEASRLHAYVKEIYINNGNQWLQLPMAYTGSLAVNVPEYILFSVGENPDQYKTSSLVSAQIFTHCIEIVDKMFMEWFTTTNTGSNMQAISRYLVSFTPCPICIGDEDKRTYVDNLSPVLTHCVCESSPQTKRRSQSVASDCYIGYVDLTKKSKQLFFDYDQPEGIPQVNKFKFCYIDSSDTIGKNPVGFTTVHCLWIAQYQDFVNCPTHGTLKLKYLAPDLVYADATDSIISKKMLTADSKQTIKQGGFGKTVKQRLINKQDPSFFTIVATKVLGRCDVRTPENILQQYNDNRGKLNMIYGLKHPRIVKFYGITVHPVGLIMEWAPLGSLDDIIKQHQSQRQHICPNSVFAVTQQVITGLQYLHKNHIVHFDIKPKNILIFIFPHESHCCYSQNYTRDGTSLQCIHCNESGELDGVVTKIANFGTSVRKSPIGFVRKIALSGHTAPEVLLHHGLEQLSEKVDMFSLGMCMYETMSCTLVPPKESSISEFNEELKNGIRPGFLRNAPRYPALLYDCMTSCWDQDPQIRPSASQLIDTLCLTKLQLIDFFVFKDYKLTNVQCCSKVYIEENKKEYLWLAMNGLSGGSFILVIDFQMHGSRVIPQVTQPLCFTEEVLKICQVHQYVYIILKGIKIVMVHSQTHKELKVNHYPFDSTVTGDPSAICCIQEKSLLLVAFSCGDIGILSLSQNQFNLTALRLAFEYDSIEKKSTQSYSRGVEGHVLCMEVVTVDKSTKDLWCGCNNNTIVILFLQSLSVEGTPMMSHTIYNVCGSAYTSCKVLQLKMINTQLVVALLDVGIVVCYNAVFKKCLKSISTSTAIVMLPCNNKLYLGTKSGQILSLDINSIIRDEVATEKPLVCGEHKADQPVFDLLTISGELSPHSFLEGFGSVHCKSYKLCKVMLSIGGGYTEFLSCSETAITVSPNDLCIISFRV